MTSPPTMQRGSAVAEGTALRKGDDEETRRAGQVTRFRRGRVVLAEGKDARGRRVLGIGQSRAVLNETLAAAPAPAWMTW